jgi:hypothetical protein
LSPLPERIRTNLIGPKDIVDSLFEHGPLSQSEYTNLVERLGSVAMNSGPAIPKPGDSLYFAGTCIETLAAIGVLSVITQRFRVHVTRREIQNVENTLISAQTRAENANWVKHLINRIAAEKAA